MLVIYSAMYGVYFNLLLLLGYERGEWRRDSEGEVKGRKVREAFSLFTSRD